MPIYISENGENPFEMGNYLLKHAKYATFIVSKGLSNRMVSSFNEVKPGKKGPSRFERKESETAVRVRSLVHQSASRAGTPIKNWLQKTRKQ